MEGPPNCGNHLNSFYPALFWTQVRWTIFSCLLGWLSRGLDWMPRVGQFLEYFLLDTWNTWSILVQGTWNSRSILEIALTTARNVGRLVWTPQSPTKEQRIFQNSRICLWHNNDNNNNNNNNNISNDNHEIDKTKASYSPGQQRKTTTTTTTTTMQVTKRG